MHLSQRTKFGACAALLTVVSLCAASCAEPDESTDADDTEETVESVPESPAAGMVVVDAKDTFELSRPPGLDIFDLPPVTPFLADSVATGFTQDSAGLAPIVPGASAALPELRLPSMASEPLAIRDLKSHLGVRATFIDASPENAQVAGGFVVYPGALDGADILHRVRQDGVEDFVRFDAPPRRNAFSYRIDLDDTVAGLRLVGNSLEFLDADGTPRLRIAPPSLMDAAGEGRPATLQLDGCDADRDPRPPWRRPTVAPGARTCEVTVTWSDAGLAYPVLVDPSWTTTASMATARWAHVAQPIADGTLLVAGGVNSGGYLSSVEIYDLFSDTWTSTTSMSETRALAGVARFSLSGTTYVLVAGGIGSSCTGGFCNTAERYSVSGATWGSAGTMFTARADFPMAQIQASPGKIIAPGGHDGTQSTDLVDLYTPSGNSWAQTDSLDVGRRGHGIAAMTSTASSRVLVTAGIDASGNRLDSVEYYTPSTFSWTTTDSLTAPLNGHTTNLITGNYVVVVGGQYNSSNCVRRGERFDPSTNTWSDIATVPGSFGLCFHAAAWEPNQGYLVVSGGRLSPSGSPVSATFYYDAIGDTWTGLSMATARDHHTASLLPDGFGGEPVMITGGLDSSFAALASAEYFTP